MSRQARYGGGEGRVPVALTGRDRQQQALGLISEVLTGEALYVAPENYTSLVRHGWAVAGGIGGLPDDTALGRLPFPVLAAARQAKRQILQNVLSPRRAVHMQHSSWALEGSQEGGLPAREVVDALHRVVWGPAVAAFGHREFYTEMKMCSHKLRTTGVCDGAAMTPFLSAARAAAVDLGHQGSEQRALQAIWIENLQKVLDREGDAVQDQLGVSAREKLGELSDQFSVLLLEGSSRRALSPEAFSHVVALRSLLQEAPSDRQVVLATAA